MSSEVTVVGGGLVGCLMAVLLQEKGYKVSVYERYDDIRSIPSVGRSINLSVTSRGLRTLDMLPTLLREELLSLGSHVTGRIIHASNGIQHFQRYGKDDSEYNHSVSRYELNKFLLQKCEEAGVKLHFSHTLTGVDLPEDGKTWATLQFKVKIPEAGTPTKPEFEEKSVKLNGPVIGADGGPSGLRYAFRKLGISEFTEDMLALGYKEMLFPKDAATAAGLELHGLHIWPRGRHFIMALVNLDGSFTGTLYMPNEVKDGGDESFAAIEAGGVDAAKAFLEKHYADALPGLGGLDNAARQLFSNGRGILGTVRTQKWFDGGRACLIGDACHALVPFFGQGMNCGFEDCREMIAQLHAHARPGASIDDYAAAFTAFEGARKPNANAIADMALENCIEMMVHTDQPLFRKRKAVENALENSSLSSRFRSRYAMVCYGGAGNVTYVAAQRLGDVQWEIVCELAESVTSPETAADELDLVKAAKLLDEKLLPLQKELAVDLSTVAH